MTRNLRSYVRIYYDYDSTMPNRVTYSKQVLNKQNGSVSASIILDHSQQTKTVYTKINQKSSNLNLLTKYNYTIFY